MKIGMYGGKFLPPHMGHVYAATKASAKVDELYIIVCFNENLDKEYCLNSKDVPYISGAERVRMLSKIFKDLPHVKVVGVGDSSNSPDKYDWDLGAKNIKKTIGKEINFVFGSEPEYKTYFAKNYPESEYILIDVKRKFYPVSATKIRDEGIFENWNFIPQEIRNRFVKKIVIVGTESCGKSTIVRNLARLYNTTCVEEYGRDVSKMMGGDSSLVENDFIKIASHQKHLEDSALSKANKIMFVDTETIVTQYYAQLFLGNQIPLLESIIKTQSYDLWLFLEPDVPWIDDGTRSMGDKDERINNNSLLKKMLIGRGIKFHSISGDYYERFEKVFELVNEIRY